MNRLIQKHPVLTASALGLLLTSLPLSAYSATSDVPPEVLKQLQELSRQVEQLQKLVNSQQKKADPVYQDDNEVAELKQKVLVLERKQELAGEELAKQKKEAPVLVAGDKGFGLKSADGNYEFKLRGLLQTDARVFQEGLKGQHAYTGNSPTQQLNDDIATRTATDNTLVRRARPIFEGKLGEDYGFRIAVENGNNQTQLVDAYIDAVGIPEAKVRVGKFTPPIGFERLQSSADTKFNELALTSNFLPSRDIGVQVGGDLLDKRLNYTLGYFNGANDGATGDIDPNTDKEIAARIFAQPFANSPGFFLQGLSFGVGASTGDAKGSNGNSLLTTYRTSGQENFFSYRTDTSATNTVLADGTRDRLVPQFSYYNGGLGVTGEYVLEKQDTTRIYGAALNQTRSEEINSDGWNLTASYILTGEEASFKSVKPSKPFDPAKGGWGAWELKARVGELNVDKDVFYDTNGVLGGTDSFAQATRSAKAAENWGVGVNWYPTGIVRFSLDYEQTAFDWGGGGTSLNPEDRDSEHLLIGRAQVSF